MANRLHIYQGGPYIELRHREGNIAVTLYTEGDTSTIYRNRGVIGEGLDLDENDSVKYEDLPLGTQRGEL